MAVMKCISKKTGKVYYRPLREGEVSNTNQKTEQIHEQFNIHKSSAGTTRKNFTTMCASMPGLTYHMTRHTYTTADGKKVEGFRTVKVTGMLAKE